MGDQGFVFNEISLKNVLSKFGFRGEIIINEFFPRELLVTAQKGVSVNLSNYKEDILFEDNIETINRVKEEL
jgi:hypothetical protein